MIRTRADLDALPMMSKVRDNYGELWEKLPTDNAAGVAWFDYRQTRPYSAAIIELPARLL